MSMDIPLNPSNEPSCQEFNQVQSDPVKRAFENAIPVTAASDVLIDVGNAPSGPTDTKVVGPAIDISAPPISPLGSKGNTYYFMSPSGELREMKAETLEAGRGVIALFEGYELAEQWCRNNFPDHRNGWSPKDVGKFIIGECNKKGIFDPQSADIRSRGVWRGKENGAILHCGRNLVFSDGGTSSLNAATGSAVYVACPELSDPDFSRAAPDTFKNLLHDLESVFGWKRSHDAAIWLGWVAAAALGGYPNWRSHLYVHASRGRGKSTLIELAQILLGDLSGDVVNDATEAGLRQSRNNHARPVLIDEFEPSDNVRGSMRQEGIITLLRRMSGGNGGITSRGGADHAAVSFRTIGSAYLTSINHIHLEPQDRSRFVMLELGPQPNRGDPTKSSQDLSILRKLCAELSLSLRGKMLNQSAHWDGTYEAVKVRLQEMGADPRQADTNATILAALDLLLFDGAIDDQRLQDLADPLSALLGDASETMATSEGKDALDHLLDAPVQLDHGRRRTVRELLQAAVHNVLCDGTVEPEAVLARCGVFVMPGGELVAIRIGKGAHISEIYGDTKWSKGAHKTALLQLPGTHCPKDPVGLRRHGKQRVILIPIDLLELDPEG